MPTVQFKNMGKHNDELMIFAEHFLSRIENVTFIKAKTSLNSQNWSYCSRNLISAVLYHN